MKIKYYDRIHKRMIEVEGNAKTKHFLEQEEEKKKKLKPEEVKKLPKKKQEEYYQRDFERSMCSLDELLDAGFQPCEERTIEQEIIKRHRERRYLNSPQYKKFKCSLQKELLRAFNVMPEYLQQVMFLRFFKDCSISEIADCLEIARGTAQKYIGRGCSYIKDFLEKDIKEQNRLERLAKEKRARKKLENS